MTAEFSSQRIRNAFIIALIFLALNIGVLFRNTLQLIELNTAIAQTLARLELLETIRASVASAESAQRGFLLTGESEYLTPYNAQTNAFDRSSARLRDLFPTDREALAVIAELEQLIDAKRDELDATIALRRNEGFEAALAVVQNDNGRRTMEEIQSRLDILKERESRRLEARSEEARRDVPLTLATFGMVAVISIVGLSIAFRLVLNDMRRRQKAEAQLQESNRQLSAGLAELKDRSRQIAQLSEMVHMLQSSADIAEALEIISLYAARLLPGEGGALYLFNASRNALEARANWGSFSIKGEEHLFEQKECWGLRLGQAYTVTDPAHEMVCLHIGAHRRPYRCIPLFGQGEALGVLHIESDPAHASPPQDDIAAAAAEQIALTLANLRLRETLRTQSIRDLLTGLYNRRYLEETFERELLRVKRKKASLAVFLFDVDHFKRFNDTFGHDAGDVVLHEVGRLLRVHTREADLACRYGGEEFVCVLPETPPTIAQARAEVLREAVAALQVTHLGQHLGPISISIGVAIYPEHGTSMEELLRAADESLYAAKQQGRNRVVIAETTGTTMSISTSLPSEPA